MGRCYVLRVVVYAHVSVYMYVYVSVCVCVYVCVRVVCVRARACSAPPLNLVEGAFLDLERRVRRRQPPHKTTRKTVGAPRRLAAHLRRLGLGRRFLFPGQTDGVSSLCLLLIV